jgi:hypothetical protein
MMLTFQVRYRVKGHNADLPTFEPLPSFSTGAMEPCCKNTAPKEQGKPDTPEAARSNNVGVGSNENCCTWPHMRPLVTAPSFHAINAI